MDLRAISLAEPLARLEKRRVCHLGVRRGGDRPAQRHAVEAVHYGRQVDPAGRDAELRDVGDPQLVGVVGAEMVPAPIVAQQVGGSGGYLALVGAVAALLLGGSGDQALVPHDAADGPLPGAGHGGDAPVAVGAAAGLEGLHHGAAGVRALAALALGPGAPRVLVAALGHAGDGQDLAEPIPGPQRRHHLRLLRVGQAARVGARVFFYYLEGRLPHVELQLHLSELYLRLAQHVLELADVIGQIVVFLAHGRAFLFGAPDIIAHDLPSPRVGRRPRHAVPRGDLRGRAGLRLQLCDDPDSLLDGDGVPLGVRAALLPLAGRQLVDPLAQRHAALRIAERPHRPGQALAVLQVVARGGPGLPVGVHRLAMAVLADGDLAGRLVLLPPHSQGVPVGKAQRGDGVGDAVVEFNVSLYGELPLLLAVHAASFLAPFWSRIPAAVPHG